jgi:hypothetical protein
MQHGARKDDHLGVEVVYAYPHCPYREVTHAAARKLPAIRKIAELFWPAARRAEWVQIDNLGIEASGLAGRTQIAWDNVSSTTVARSPLGRRTLVIADDRGRRIVVASTLPEFDELSKRVLMETRTPEAVLAA